MSPRIPHQLYQVLKSFGVIRPDSDHMAGLPNEADNVHATHASETAFTNGIAKDDISAVHGFNGAVAAKTSPPLEMAVDVLIVGGGFGGMYGLYHLRKLGLSVKLFEAGSDFGGTWNWNRYPGARVDSESPFYGFSIPEVYNTWEWSERFAGHEEIRRYFEHVDKVLDLKKDAFFHTIVVEADFDPGKGRWRVRTDKGTSATTKYLVLATGSSYKTHLPDFGNIDTYEGRLLHSASFPGSGVELVGKKVGIVGNGATGVQLIQELAREDCELTAFVRTPNIALPMQQRQLSRKEQIHNKSFYDALFQTAKDSRNGYPYNAAPKTFYEATPEERLAYWEILWQRGGFSFLISNYPDLVSDKRANAEVYSFWVQKVRARVHDEFKRDVVAPLQ